MQTYIKKHIKNFIEQTNGFIWGFFTVTLISLLIVIFNGFSLGIDFAGGLVFDFSPTERVLSGQKTKSNTIQISGMDFDTAIINLTEAIRSDNFVLQDLGRGRLSLKIGGSVFEGSKGIITVKQAIYEVFGDVKFNQIESIGPQVSKTLVKQSFFAVMFALVTMTLYLLIRFNLPFAISGVMVLICNVIMTCAFVSLTKIEMNLTIMAAFLTLVGYCINDTVVLYDRIRSHIASKQDRKIADLIKISIKEMLTRSIITSFVTILSLVGIVFFSDRTIKNFGIVVIFGIIVGTMGSIFVASTIPLVFGLKRSKPKQLINQKKKDPMIYAS